MTDQATKAMLIAKFEHDVAKRTRFYRFLLALDQLCNVVFWNGSQDETISSHIARRQNAGTATWFDNKVCCILKHMQQNHCNRSEGE
jgi:hypothetical protein